MEPTEPTDNLRLRLRLEHAIAQNYPTAVLELLTAEPNTGLSVLGAGFGASMIETFRGSFATYCMTCQAESVLEAVLRSNLADPQTLLKASCTWLYSKIEKNGSREAPVEHFQTLAYAAMVARSRPGTLLAIEFESDAPKMRAADSNYLRGSSISYHAEALRHALSTLSTELLFERSADVCRAYIENNLPVQKHVPGESAAVNCALYEFVTTTMFDERTHVVSLFRDYLAAGYFGDINARLHNGSESTLANGKIPLAGAILRNNRQIAVELVLAGADISGIGDDVGFPGMDIVEVVRARGRPDAEAFAAGLTHALMSRRLGDAQETNPDEQPPAPGRARRRKMTV